MSSGNGEHAATGGADDQPGGHPGDAENIIDEQPTAGDQGSQGGNRGGQDQANEAAAAGLDVEEFVRELAKNVDTVENWTVHDVIREFLTPIGLSHLSQPFLDHKVNGASLLHLDKPEIKEIGYSAETGPRRHDECGIKIGDRVYLMNVLTIIKKGRNAFARDKVIWSYRIPEGSFQYYESLYEMCQYRICPCCMFHDLVTLSGRGLEVKSRPPRFCCFACGNWVTDFNDMRFLKDIDHLEKPKCCCFCPYREAMLTFGDDEDEDARDNNKPPKVVKVRHPAMTDAMMSHMRSVWAELRLVDS